MKIISKTIKILPLFLLALGFTSCSDDDDNGVTNPPQELNIVETASATADLSILVAALQAADGDLVNVLSGSGPFTVLAPTNAAFQDFLDDNDFDDLDDIPTDVLSQVLLNHVITGNLSSTDLTNLGAGYTRTNASSPSDLNMSIYYNTSNGVRFNGVSSVTNGGADIDASNGTVHIVDAVIGLPTVATFATADENFSSLVASLAEADDSDADPMLIPTLSADGTFTVFAPINSAFTALLDSNDDWNSPADIDDDLLNNVLLHHVRAAQIITSSMLTGDDTIEMLNNQNIVVTTPGTGTIADITDGAGNEDIGIIAVDVQASNGVIHAINKVMLPGADDDDDDTDSDND